MKATRIQTGEHLSEFITGKGSSGPGPRYQKQKGSRIYSFPPKLRHSTGHFPLDEKFRFVAMEQYFPVDCTGNHWLLGMQRSLNRNYHCLYCNN